MGNIELSPQEQRAIAVGAILVGLTSFGVDYHLNKEKEGRIPLAFSEFSHILRDHARKGQPVPPLTRFYAALNDGLMNVFEANNVALRTSRSHKTFASELEVNTDPSLRVHRQIGEFAAELPDDAKAAIASLDKLVKAKRDLAPALSDLQQTWDESHHDVTHTEYHTDTSCDANGDCTTSVEAEEVYDYTIHKYTYNSEYGLSADLNAQSFLQKNPDLNIHERLYFVSKTEAENEYAIEKSMAGKLENRIPNQQELLKFANIWATGSNYMRYMPVIMSSHKGFSNISPIWSKAALTAKSERYITYSHNDDGPEEYQIEKEMQGHAEKMDRGISTIVNGIEMAGYAFPALHNKINQYIGVVLDKKPGDPDKLRSEIMKEAVSIYKANFSGGLDVQPFKWREVALVTLIGSLGGGLIGFGAQVVADKRRQPKTRTYDQG